MRRDISRSDALLVFVTTKRIVDFLRLFKSTEI